MPTFEQHCTDCLMKLGEKYEDVHRWLDEYAKKYNVWQYGPYHRHFRHHKQGVNEVRRMWGEGAAKAAELHILFDMGYIPNQEPVKEIYKRLLEEADNEI